MILPDTMKSIAGIVQGLPVPQRRRHVRADDLGYEKIVFIDQPVVWELAFEIGVTVEDLSSMLAKLRTNADSCSLLLPSSRYSDKAFQIRLSMPVRSC
jgi:hypothetical protein